MQKSYNSEKRKNALKSKDYSKIQNFVYFFSNIIDIIFLKKMLFLFYYFYN